jgi:recombination protein RecA
MAKEKEEVKADLSKAETIAKTKKELDKKWGKGTVIGAKDKPMECEAISTGSIGLDYALGIGGLPKGRVVEVYGPESSGKTTLCLEVIAQAHKNPNSYCAIVDAEHAIDTGYAAALGVDLNRLEISQPNNGEEALDVAETLIQTGAFDIVVIDSVAALVPKAEVDRDMGEPTMGAHARLMSSALRKLTPVVAKSNSILIFINQLRDKIGVMFGSPETTTGGNALKFYASVRLDIRRSVTTANSLYSKDNKDEKIGNQVTVKVIKNKLAPPFKKCEFDVYYGEGIDKLGEIFKYGIDNEIITKNGTFFSYGGTSLGQGKEKVLAFLRDNPELAEEIKEKVIHSFTVVLTTEINEEVQDDVQ